MFAAVQDWPAPDEVAVYIGAILPIVIALATHVGAGARVRGLVTTVLGFLAGPVATWINGAGEPIVSRITASNSVAAYTLAMVTYFMFWKPVLDVNAKVLPNVGLGKPKTT